MFRLLRCYAFCVLTFRHRRSNCPGFFHPSHYRSTASFLAVYKRIYPVRRCCDTQSVQVRRRDRTGSPQSIGYTSVAEVATSNETNWISYLINSISNSTMAAVQKPYQVTTKKTIEVEYGKEDVDDVGTRHESTEQEKKDERFKKDQASLSSHECGWWYEEKMPTKDSCIDSHKKMTQFPNLH